MSSQLDGIDENALSAISCERTESFEIDRVVHEAGADEILVGRSLGGAAFEQIAAVSLPERARVRSRSTVFPRWVARPLDDDELGFELYLRMAGSVVGDSRIGIYDACQPLDAAPRGEDGVVELAAAVDMPRASSVSLEQIDQLE